MKKYLPSNLWKSPVILKRLYAEACFECEWGVSEKKHYWCMVPMSDSKDGINVLKNYEDGISNADPHDMQQVFASKIMTELQQEAHFDGLWLVGFTHPPTSYGVLTDTENCWSRWIAIWFDEDGDPQFTLESDLPFMNQVEMGAPYYVGLAQKSHAQWKEMYGRKAMKSDMILKEGQSSKAALEALR